jgi:hypothetical protein
MNYFKEKKLAFWAIILLVLLNISTLTMIWIHRPPRPELSPIQLRKFIPDFVVNELKLDEKQAKAFETAEKNQKIKINVQTDSLRYYKKELFSQCFDNPTDTVKINGICNKIGEIAIKIDILTFNHINELKSICNEEQQKILKEFIKDMASADRRPHENEPPPPRL